MAINKLMGNETSNSSGFIASTAATGAAYLGYKKLTGTKPPTDVDSPRTGRTTTGAPKDIRRMQTGAGSRFDRQMDANLKGLRQFPKLLKLSL